MGMSASQMRYAMLAGRKNDVEFEGQQINQERTTLANESAALNTQLLNLTVPTTPSTDDYTKTTYTFSNDGATYSIAATQYQASGYDVVTTTKAGTTTTISTTSYSAGTYIVSANTDQLTSKGQSSGTGIFTKITGADGSANYQKSGGTVLTKAAADEHSADYATDVANIAMICEDCNVKDASGKFYGDAGYVTPTFYTYSVNGTKYYISQTDLDQQANTITYTTTAAGTTTSTSTQTNNGISMYYVNDSAKETVPTKLYGATVVWGSDNRMTTLVDSNHHTYTLSCTTTTDENAYNQALYDYEYQKEIYNQDLNNINAQIDVIQSQDKKLEIKLQNLDTQNNAINTEMESVKKVIDKNIESSFKAFA